MNKGLLTYREIVQFVLVGAPNCIPQIVVLVDDANSLVSIVAEEHFLLELINRLEHRYAPKLDSNVLSPGSFRALEAFFGQRNWLAVEACPKRCVSQTQKCGCEVGMGSDDLADLALWHSGAADQQRDVGVFQQAALFSRIQTVLADVEPIVRGVKDVGVVQDVILLQLLDHAVDELINGLQRTKTLAVVVVDEVNVLVCKLLPIPNPIRTRGLIRIEVLRTGDFDILEEMLMTLRRNGRCDMVTIKIRMVCELGPFIRLEVAVRSYGSDTEKERLLSLGGVVQKPVRLGSQDVNRMLSDVTDWWVVVALIRGIQIVVGAWIQEKV